MPVIMAFYVLGGLILILLALPLILRRVPPNPVYGFRIQWTRDDPDLWYSFNAHIGKRLAFVGACSLIGSIVLVFVPGITLLAYIIVCLVIFLVSLGIGVVQSIRFLRMMESQK